MDKSSLTLGWLVGRQIAGQRRTQEKQPIAYLYNGVQLPPLPEWDKVKYPYAFIWEFVGIYKLSVFDTPLRYGIVNGEHCIYLSAGAEGLLYNSKLTDGEYKSWEYVKEEIIAESVELTPFWANHNVISDSDGSAYLEASDPIPVYEPDEPEKQLIGYSYNGVVLPDINKVWTDELKQQYPYAVIAYEAPYETYVTFMSTAPMYVNADNFFACSTNLTASLCMLNSGVWELGETVDFGAEDLTYPMSYLKMTWSSYDVLWDDGSVYSASSDPIPVYNTGQTETAVYDNTWPIEWVPSAMTNNLKYYDIVKVSNLTPTAEKMQSAVLTLENQVFNCTSTNTAMDGVTVYVYTDADGSDIALFVVSDNSLTDTGLYATDLGDDDCKLTLSL